MDKKRMAKTLVGGAAYIAVATKGRSVICNRVKKQPNRDIVVQLFNTFCIILYILYVHYYVEGNE